ncbi:uncharacterized protein LOC130632435 [Hydractinia symbiolongicarpus]|uniref:uncharacterized protein LOC130632435 n=1 Tax=Hydractinia symbiolongicarpus TaxID=13093 RepID=UPI0025514799|nr:uncharacterized protein LOC130632435 [Hydractinia symbiolongicarpus]XP_057300457.1 uncharacterized protein LOC130632435 [Hydractinia symbiolongicarpus]
MAAFDETGVLRDPLTRVSKQILKAVRSNENIVHEHDKKMKKLEREKQKEHRRFTNQQYQIKHKVTRCFETTIQNRSRSNAIFRNNNIKSETTKQVTKQLRSNTN